jgi:alpha-ketoglutarate-dependent taurine dioxygenase
MANAVADMRSSGSLGGLSWEFLEPFGVRVQADDIRALGLAEQQQLARLLYAHGFVETTAPGLTKEELRQIGGYVAPLLPEEHEANPVLAVRAEEGGFGTRALELHRDLSYAEHPFSAIALHALAVNPGETTTVLASGVRAYRLLQPELRERIAGLQVFTAVHGRTDGQLSGDADKPGWPAWTHPLVSTHPVTGEPVLYVCEMSSVRIEGLDPSESESLLQELFGFIRAESNRYEHRWYDDDLLIWDNFGCVHARPNLEGVSKRTLQRLTMGKLSFPMAFPDFNMRAFTDATQGDNYMGDGGGRF